MGDSKRRVSVRSIRNPRDDRAEISVPEWADDDGEPGIVELRKLTRAHMKIVRDRAGIGTDEPDPNLADLLIVAYSFADPDLVGELGEDGAVDLLEAQPASLITRLVREALTHSAATADARFRDRAGDDDER